LVSIPENDCTRFPNPPAPQGDFFIPGKKPAARLPLSPGDTGTRLQGQTHSKTATAGPSGPGLSIDSLPGADRLYLENLNNFRGKAPLKRKFDALGERMSKEGPETTIEAMVAQARRDGVTAEADLPFWLPARNTCHGRTLLVHGLTATPWEMRGFAEGLADAGFAALGIRLPGHGTTPEDLAATPLDAWLAAVETGLTLLQRQGDTAPVYGIGMSTGGLLLAALADSRALNGLVLLSPFLRMNHPLAPVSGLLSRFMPFQEKTVTGPGKGHYYECRPLAAIAEVHRLTRRLRRDLEKVGQPTLVVGAEGDQTVDADSGLELFRRLGSVRKEYVRLGPEVPHVLTTPENPRWRRVLQLTVEFLRETAGDCP
jgi:carboxylesterase